MALAAGERATAELAAELRDVVVLAFDYEEPACSPEWASMSADPAVFKTPGTWPTTEAMGRGSWLFPDGVDRERMLEMDRQLQPVRRASFAVIALALVASGPWLGWWTLVPLAGAAVLFRAR